ncbi:MAG: DUF445 family protein [Longimicrobiales bacterium]|nr:DUF445 family protein [Longimicrobiales bacterium]
MPDEILRPLVIVLFGALSGGLTNTVAIWMLFHPYTPPRLFGRWRVGWLQGAVPKNQARLAAAIGRTVGNRLLTADDLQRILSDGEFRRAFDERLAAFLDEVLHRERESLKEILPPAVLPEVEGLLQKVARHTLDRLDRYLASPEFEAAVDDRLEALVAAVEDQPIGDLVTPAREATLTQALEEWLENAVHSPDFEGAVADYLERASHRLLQPGRTFEEILPLGLVGSMEKAISGYLPLAIARLGSLLEDPAARRRFEVTIRDLFHRFVRDLKFHQRMVARLVVTDDTLDRILDTIEKEGAERLSEILRDPAVQDAMARGVNEAVVDFLRRPVDSVLGTPDSDNVVETRATLAGWVVGMAQDAQSRAFLVEKLRTALERAGSSTWGEFLQRVPPERIRGWVVAGARSRTARRVLEDLAAQLVRTVWERPIGTPARWLPDDAATRMESALGPILWEWLQGQVPDVVQRLDVARRVEEKVLDFPTPRMEDLVRKVTHRELRLIVKLGYALGAFVGVVLVLVDGLLP